MTEHADWHCHAPSKGCAAHRGQRAGEGVLAQVQHAQVCQARPRSRQRAGEAVVPQAQHLQPLQAGKGCRQRPAQLVILQETRQPLCSGPCTVKPCRPTLGFFQVHACHRVLLRTVIQQ